MTRARLTGVCLAMLVALPLAARAQTPATPADKAEAFGAAARRGDAATVAKLLDEGVDVNTKFRYDVTAISYAADHGHLEVVKVLLAHNANVNVKDTFYNATPLSWAAGPAQKRKPEHAQIVGLLLKAGAQGKEGALNSAVGASDAAMVKVILDVGGLPPAALSDALEAATAGKKTEIVTMLETAGAKPHPVFTLDEAQMAKYAGTFRAPNGAELVVAIVSGRLSLNASRVGGPPQIALAGRNETTFVAPDTPGVRVVFKIEDAKVTAIVLGPTTYARVGGN